MIDRRSLIALGISVPAAGWSRRLDLPDPRIHPINTGGVRVVGISLDASMLVGTRDNETMCILDAGTRETLAETDPIPEMRLLDTQSVRWSPDGTRLAFSLLPWIQLRDSDIFVMDVVTGELTNVTPEGNDEEAQSLMDEQDANVDVNPVWLDDDTLVFGRHQFSQDEGGQLRLMRISLTDLTMEEWIDLTPAGVEYLTSPIWQRPDGSLIFGTDGRRSDRNVSIAMMVSPDGTVEETNLGEGGGMRLMDVNETHLIAFDARMFSYVYIPLDAPDERGDIWDHFELPATYRFRSDPKFGPEQNTLLLLAENDNDQFFVLQVSESETTEIAELYNADGTMAISWAEDVILVTSDDPAWLIQPDD